MIVEKKKKIKSPVIPTMRDDRDDAAGILMSVSQIPIFTWEVPHCLQSFP